MSESDSKNNINNNEASSKDDGLSNIPKEILDFYARLKGVVDEKGVALMLNNQHNKEQVFYTIGMAKYNLPDLVLSGPLSIENISIIILNTVHRWIDNGVKLGINLDIFEDINGKALPCYILPITPTENDLDNTLAHSEGFYTIYPDYFCRDEGNPHHAQIIWPDQNNLFPGEHGYDDINCPQNIFLKSHINKENQIVYHIPGNGIINGTEIEG